MAGAMRKTMMYLGLADEAPQAHDDVAVDEYVDSYDYDDLEETEQPMARQHEAQVTPISRAATPGSGLRRITTVHPRSYNDAATIGAAFRAGTPVIMNLTEMSDADAKRIVDFSAGLIFGLHGAMERVTTKVFLLSPAHVEISTEEKGQAGEPSFFNQS